MQKYELTLRFTTELLGMQPQKRVAQDYILSKAKQKNPELKTDDEEITLDEMLEKGTTAFHKDNGQPILFDYHVKGFLKEAASVLKSEIILKQPRSKIDNWLFIFPRKLKLSLPKKAQITFNERPIRAMTMMGPRVSLIRSEQVPEGTTLKCEILVINKEITTTLLRKLLDYGALKGLGQWRNASWGRFDYELKAKV